jgi:chaperonin GroEL (HSP60 family)
LADLAVKACIRILPENAKGFDVEYIRVQKILGSSILQSEVVNGLVV